MSHLAKVFYQKPKNQFVKWYQNSYWFPVNGIRPNFDAKSLKLWEHYWFMEERWSSAEKKDFLFCVNNFVQDCRLLIFFWRYPPKLVSDIKMHIGVLYVLNSINFKILKQFVWISAHI